MSHAVYGASASDGAIGRVISVRGSKAQIGMPVPPANGPMRATVGGFLAITAGPHVLVGIITEVTATDALGHGAVAYVDLIGEIAEKTRQTEAVFVRGVSAYPTIGDAATILQQDHLRLIFEAPSGRSITIGSLHNDAHTAARVDVDSLLTRHFAILGSTGVGKSTGVAILLNEIIAVRSDLRVFLLDSHNEYGRCFGKRANVIRPRDLKLPFWLFNFEEFSDVIYGGRPGVEEELEILADLIPAAKNAYTQYKAAERLVIKRPDAKSTGYTIDTPVPYLIQDLLSLIDERMGKLENRASRMHYHRLMNRIETIRNDPRYDFMFENANVGGDTMAELLNQLFRVEANGKPITVMQLAGLPVETLDAVVCVLCRMAFDFALWSDGSVPLLFVCEEAHRYASADHSIGFGPTRRALSKIAKEGRKYCVFLGLVSQRPAELDPTVLSQCATLFAMRMTNDRDQAVLRSAVSDATAELLSFVPSLGTREVIGFDEGVPLPARMTFKSLDSHLLPTSEPLEAWDPRTTPRTSKEFVQDIVDRWRRSAVNRKQRGDESHVAAPSTAPEEAGTISANIRLDHAKYQLLKR